jgi:hypothetical protein
LSEASLSVLKHRSRITNGSELLPGIDGRSAWARLLRDQIEALTAHLGGADRMSEPERMTARRAAALEAELVFLEAKIAELRTAGLEPPERLVDLYARLANGQRRHLEALGFDRRQRDVTPDPLAYARERALEERPR